MLHVQAVQERRVGEERVVDGPMVCLEPVSPYIRWEYTNKRVRKEIEAAAPWLEVKLVSDDWERFDMMTENIEAVGVVD